MKTNLHKTRNIKKRNCFVCILLFLFLGNKLIGQTPIDSTESSNNDFITDLFHQINNPTASTAQIQYSYDLLPEYPGLTGPINSFSIQPTIPIGPFRSFPFVQSVRITASYSSIPSPINETGANDFQIYDLLLIKKKWGRWGFGPILIFPTAPSADSLLGAGKWQVGPAFVLTYTGHKKFTLGALLQNPISIAGDPERANTSSLIFQPTLTINLQKGWFVGLTDYNWTFNWAEGGEPTIPIGIQLGKVFKLAKQHYSFSVEAGRQVAIPQNMINPGWLYGFEFTQLFNWHVGPKKINR